MKTARLLFMIVGFGALTLALSVADDAPKPPPQPAPAQKHAETSGDRPADDGQGAQSRSDKGQADSKHPDDNKADRPPSQKISPAGKARTTTGPHAGLRSPQPAQASGVHPGDRPVNDTATRNTTPSAAGLPSLGLNKPAVAAKAGSTINPTGSFRSLPLAGLSTPPPPKQVVPHTGPGPATIGGPANSSARTTAVLDGTGMKRKP
jgi:hypothetical protein